MNFEPFTLFLTFLLDVMTLKLHLISATYSNFKANNNIDFKIFLIYFGIFPAYYRVFFQIFGPILIVIFIFVLSKREIVRFLTLIVPYTKEKNTFTTLPKNFFKK